jgi:RNA polymerase sigma-70 factor (ECF subfamily)
MERAMNDLDPKTQALLDSVRSADGPTRREKERVRRRVLARVAGALLAASAGATSTKSAASAAAVAIEVWSTKVVVSVIAASVLVAGGAVTTVVASHRHSASSVASVARTTTLAVPAPSVVAATPAVAPMPLQVALRQVTEVEPVAVRRPLVPHPAVSRPAPANNETLEEELPLLQSAQAALNSGDTDRALSLLEVHAKRFPVGALSEERRAAHALITCRKTAGASAAAEAEAFIRESPSSPLVERVRNACLLARP